MPVSIEISDCADATDSDTDPVTAAGRKKN